MTDHRQPENEKCVIDRSDRATATPTGLHGRGDQSLEVIAAAIVPRIRSGRAPANVAEPDRPLDVSEQLRVALARVDALETNGLLLRQKVALLRRSVARARRIASYDELTGLPNRRLLLDRFNQAVALAARQHRLVALLFLDLNRFKDVNDTRGHAAGDKVLQQVAVRLRASMRASDTACRFGGDEFVVLLPELAGRRSALAAASKIRTRLAAPYAVDGREISVTASIGTAVYPIDGHSFGHLMRAMDASMYRDKAGYGRPRDCPAPEASEVGTVAMSADQTEF